MRDDELIKELIGLMMEARIREADLTDGSKTTFGSTRHIKDLETRIEDLVKWRDRQRKGTEARANYSRLIGRLRNELASAKRAVNKNTSKKVR
jgi:hypothetical protein